MRRVVLSWAALLILGIGACGGEVEGRAGGTAGGSDLASKLAQYTSVRLTADLSRLSERERRMIPLLIAAAREMDSVFWRQVYPARDSLLSTLDDSAARAYVLLNYGPWDRLDGNAPFVPGVGPRPPGAAFYPADMTKQEFEAAAAAAHQLGELPGADLDDNYVTFLAGIFRSVRFGAASAHGRANAAELSFLQQLGAFARNAATGRYRVDLPRMGAAVDSMAGLILRFQGDGDYEGVQRFMTERATLAPELRADLERLGGRGIPVDIIFEQGVDVLGMDRL